MPISSHITSNATPSEIQDWKGDPSVERCYNKLFKKVMLGRLDTYMTNILNKTFKDKKEKKNIAKIKIQAEPSRAEPKSAQLEPSQKLASWLGSFGALI